MAQEGLVQTIGGAVGSRSLLRRMNSLGILRAVMERTQTMRELTLESGLSRTAVDSIAGDLVDMGWVTAVDVPIAGRLGRPAAAYRVTAGLGHFLSIDIGANHVYTVVTDLTEQVLGHLSTAIDESTSAEDRIATAVELSDRLLAGLGLDRQAVWTVAIGSPGAISANGVVLHYGGAGMPGWIGMNLRERINREFDAAVLVEGDVALGAHAELAVGAARGHSDIVYVLCGVRTSGASIVNGRVHRGVHGAAGIVGEMPELRWADLNETYGSAVLSDPRPSRQEIFELARNGNGPAIAAVDEFAVDLATGAAAMVLALDPELLVIGGGSAPGADVFLTRFETTLRSICPLPPQIAVSTLGSEAVAVGGISLAAANLGGVLETAVRDREAFPSPPETRALVAAAA